MTEPVRHIPLSGAKNFRDFGGYASNLGGRVTSGALYRSDRLSELSDEDLAILSPLGIRTICDLRRERERRAAPTRWHQGDSTSHRHLPLIGEEGPTTLERIVNDAVASRDRAAARQIMIDLYLRLVTDRQALDHLRQLFQLIADGEVPVLIHCSGGKDRTGVSCALILWTLGVAMDDIMADFMLSQTLYADRVDINAMAPQVFDHQQSGHWDVDALRPVYSVEPAYLDTAMGHVRDTYRDAEGFVTQGLGLEADIVAEIRRNLLRKDA